MRARGEFEAAIGAGITRFEQDYRAGGPKQVHAFRIGDLLMVRLREVLTSAEQQLVRSLPPEKGRDLLKQVRTQLVATARPVLEEMVEVATGTRVVSLHHDISTATGEEVGLFTLSEPPRVCDARKKEGLRNRGRQRGWNRGLSPSSPRPVS